MSIRILHLEDDPIDAELVENQLQGLDCEMTVVDTPAAFDAALKDGAHDMIISDYNVPGFNGAQALLHAQRSQPEIPFIFCSGTIGEERAIDALKRGATDYVLKDRMARLDQVVRRALSDAKVRREHRKAQEALENERQFLKALLESLDVGIAACDAGGTLRLHNRATEAILGLSAGGTRRLDTNQVALQRALQGERVRDLEVTIPGDGGGERTVLCNAVPIVDGGKRTLGAVVAMHDVTKQKSLEEQVRQSQKMEAVGQLAGGVAHDFNNLLTTILGYSELILVKYAKEPHLTEMVAEIKKAGDRASDITRQLLGFSSSQMVAPLVIDINDTVRDMEKMLKHLIAANIELIPSLDSTLCGVEADAGQLGQVLLNLVINARDSLHGREGRIEMGTTNVTLDGTDPLECKAPGDYVMLFVRDSGKGMDAATKARIFEPFFTTKDKGKGTGLGLSTVYGIVKQNGGMIEVDSAPGLGTTFRIYFPATEIRAERTSPMVPAVFKARDERHAVQGSGPRRMEREVLVKASGASAEA